MARIRKHRNKILVYIRRHKEIIMEILVYVLYIIIVICAFWLVSRSHDALAKMFGITDKVELNLDSIASILGIVAAALAIIINNRLQTNKVRQTSRNQIYQALELESINLFRFEIEHADLAMIIWDNERITFDELQKDKEKAYQVLQHICQTLNLFEMAVRFRREGIAHEDVFESWEVWIFDLCKSQIFLHYWYLEGLRDQYIKLFQVIIDDGLLYCHDDKIVETVISKRDSSENQQLKGFRRLIKSRLNI